MFSSDTLATVIIFIVWSIMLLYRLSSRFRQKANTVFRFVFTIIHRMLAYRWN